MAMFNVASLAVVKQLGEIRLILLQKKLDALTINETRLDQPFLMGLLVLMVTMCYVPIEIEMEVVYVFM